MKKFHRAYYWRDKSGHEVDLIIDNVTHLKPVEIKSSSTINSSYFENLDYWMALSGTDKGYLIYTGLENQSRTKYEVLSWNSLNDL
jgi:predicted AAA+ superfamily ATPase